MPRLICAGVPHHVTQRGNRRGQVFFADSHRRVYLDLLREYTSSHAVDVLAYCLMPNHVHLVLVPATCDGLHRALKPLHMRHAQRLNRERGWIGHLWQGRYFSSPLDERYLWAAIRYVELNPVRAGMVARAGDHPWSSAASRCSGAVDAVLTTDAVWRRRLSAVGDWSTWLAGAEAAAETATLRSNARKGLPCGSEEFVAGIERATGRVIRERPRGRPRKG
jgi:putative transposase